MGKFKEISLFNFKENIEKFRQLTLKIKSPKETGKTFVASNAKLKANYFSKFVLIYQLFQMTLACVLNLLDNKPGIYSARWAKKYGSFHTEQWKLF